MKLFEVRYDGMWRGGKAIVFATSKSQAINAVKNHSLTQSFITPLGAKPKAIELPMKGVVYNDSGEY